MVERNIKMKPDDVKEFVRITTGCDFEIDIFYNHYIVDAKSFLGVMGLNFNQVLTVRYDGYNPTLENYLKAYAVAC